MKKYYLLLVFCFSCSAPSPVAPSIEYVPDPTKPNLSSSLGQNTNNTSIKNKDFSAEMSSRALNISNTDLDTIRKYQKTLPIGKWAYAENSTPKDVLESNFNEFKQSFKPNIPIDSSNYMELAMRFAKSTNFYARYYFDTTYFKSKNKVLVAKWDPQTKEFIIIHLDGRVSNYQSVNNLSTTRYVLIPDNI